MPLLKALQTMGRFVVMQREKIRPVISPDQSPNEDYLNLDPEQALIDHLQAAGTGMS